MHLRYRWTLLFVFASLILVAQSTTTQKLHESNKEALAAFLYHNTLRMLNQSDDPEFDALIKDIEKMKFLMIDKKFGAFDYKKLVANYKSESFEEVMTSRYQGKSFDIFREGKQW